MFSKHCNENWKPKATANVGRTISPDLIEKTRRIVNYYTHIPLVNFSTLWELTYGEPFDAFAMGFKDGIPEFFCVMAEYASIRIQAHDIYTTEEPKTEKPPTVNCVNNLPKKKQHFIFNVESDFLWLNHIDLLKKTAKELVIAMSPLEMALRRDINNTHSAMYTIQKILQQNPNGLKIQDLPEIFGYKMAHYKKIFNVPSISAMVTMYPEIFLEVRKGDYRFPEITLFDGSTKTYDEIGLSESQLRQILKRRGKKPEAISLFSCVSGLYQMTCILLKKAGPNGLRLCSWKKSIEDSFGSIMFQNQVTRKDYLAMLLEFQPLDIIQSLSACGLLSLKSSKSFKNDLRIHLPSEQFDFDAKFLSLRDHYDSTSSGNRKYLFHNPPSSDSDYQTASLSACSPSSKSSNSDD